MIEGAWPSPWLAALMARFFAGLAAMSIILLSGCDTFGSDMKDVTKNLVPKTPAEAARDSVDPYDADKRREGTMLLSNAPWGGTEVYVREYRDKVDHEPDPIVKATAIRALGRHGSPEDALRIVPHLTAENPQVRWESAKALQRLHNDAVVPDLLKCLRSDAERSDVRVAAAIALGQYAEDRVFQGLVSALNARELAINVAACRSLVTLTGEDFGLDGVSWLAWYNHVPKGESAFARGTEYLYPTYSRPDSVWEKMAFWSSRNFEQPAPPAGLQSKSARSTYADQPTTSQPATKPAAVTAPDK